MSGTIFLLQEGTKLVGMEESAYDSEDLLQKLLADHPDLLAGEQIDSDQPRKWVLVSREMPVPGEEDGAGRWSLDHLFLDQDGIPTLVEVKRSSDTRLRRREVIGQMLDYAANAVVHWPVEKVRAQFEQTAKARGIDPAETLGALLGNSETIDEYWQNVKTNLQAGRVRLVLVADEIPPETRRIIEFLNGQMDPAEVLAIEVKQFKGSGGLVTLVPRVLGQTAIAEQKKSSKSGKSAPISEAEFLKTLEGSVGQRECQAATGIIAWAKQHSLGQNFNKRQVVSSYTPFVEQVDGYRYSISVQSGGKVYVQMRWLRSCFPFRDQSKRDELWQKLNEIPGVNVSQESMTGYPGITLQTLGNDNSLRMFLDTMTWVVRELRRAHQETKASHD